MDLAKCTVAKLKAMCKEAGVSGGGEKPDLVNRLKLHAKGEDAKLDGVNPSNLKAGDLKKALATRGLPCSLDLETRDQLVSRLVDAVKAETGGGSAGGSGGGGAASSGGGGNDADDAIALAVDIAKQVLALGEAGDAAGVLSLLGASVTAQTPFADQRKAYLQLSRMIHPDKLARHFDGATRAFQELVRAFDEVTAPPKPTDEGAKSKATTISRSNKNCYKTRIFCPRCDAEWGTQDSGLQNYDYNLIMQGLKLYCCGLCLCEFGCVSARHRCPHCIGPFAYHPKDYHRELSCGSKKCVKTGATFGFMLYHVPPRVENELRQQIKAEQERRMKAREASAARQARAARKQPAMSDGARMRQAEKLFCSGLIDACPRCGFEPKGGETSREELEAHLAECTDGKAHDAHRKRVAAEAEAAQKKHAVQDAEAEAQNEMAWKFLGGETEQMWMLTDKTLRKQADERGLGGIDTSTASREELLVALSKDQKQREKQQATAGARLTASASATAGGSGGGGGSSGGASAGASAAASAGGGDEPRPVLKAESLPSNLHSLSLAQLKAVCASHGMLAKGSTTGEVIAEIEAALWRGTDAAPLLLEGGGARKGPAAAKQRVKPGGGDDDGSDDSDPEDDDNDDDDDDDEPLSKRKKRM